MNGSDDRSLESLLREHHRLLWEGVGEYPAIAPSTRDLVKQNTEIKKQRKEFRRGVYGLILTIVGSVAVLVCQQWYTAWQVEQDRAEQTAEQIREREMLVAQQAEQLRKQEEQLLQARFLLEQQEAIRQANLAAAKEAQKAAASAKKSADVQTKIMRDQQKVQSRTTTTTTTTPAPRPAPERWRWPWQ